MKQYSQEESYSSYDLSKPHISRSEIQTILRGINPKSLENYRRALVHKSLQKHIKYTLDKGDKVCSYLVAGNGPASNERLEYLGDAVFNIIVANYLYEKYPDKDEGFLTRLRTKIVRNTHCVKFSNIIGLGPYIIAGNIVKKTPEGIYNDKIMEDAFEAFLGALFLDLGYKFVNDYLTKLINDEVDFEELLQDDNYKDILMRLTQLKGISLPEYRVIKQSGPTHKKIFTIQIYLKIDSRDYPMGISEADNKKQAEQEAAYKTLTMFNNKDLDELAGRDITNNF